MIDPCDFESPEISFLDIKGCSVESGLKLSPQVPTF
jgi:hypothetical protein